ncbi:pentatricopeptide repeat-containing protein At5g61800-like [Phragmites australis]|uniref:pentatricopeptide repeat-containing protein At5g61800-like n=1 Tax=Phragmites australis TaxID=29695 RepID=UPI002D77A397|nr:pentatricopeptide repeat-containing protein At5g61800-like [Phragmites australis]
MLAQDVVSYNALLHGCVRAGRVAIAREVFQGMLVRDASSWGTLVAGRVKARLLEEVVGLFDRMRDEGFRLDNVALEKGQEVHDYVKQSRPRQTCSCTRGLLISTSSVGVSRLLGRCSSRAPRGTCSRGMRSWPMAGLAMHGHGTVALEYLDRMLAEGIQPDGVTFLGVLIGCSHTGLVGIARCIFCDMEGVHNVPRELKHYGCMADLLGCAGRYTCWL